MSICVCGHTEGTHRSIPPHRCQHYFTGERCDCSGYMEDGDRWQFDSETERMRDYHDGVRLSASPMTEGEK